MTGNQTYDRPACSTEPEATELQETFQSNRSVSIPCDMPTPSSANQKTVRREVTGITVTKREEHAAPEP
jgi:hypothetical protein